MNKYIFEYEINRNGDPKVHHNKIEGDDIFIISHRTSKDGTTETKSWEYLENDKSDYHAMMMFTTIMFCIQNILNNPSLFPEMREIFSNTFGEVTQLEETMRKKITYN